MLKPFIDAASAPSVCQKFEKLPKLVKIAEKSVCENITAMLLDAESVPLPETLKGILSATTKMSPEEGSRCELIHKAVDAADCLSKLRQSMESFTENVADDILIAKQKSWLGDHQDQIATLMSRCLCLTSVEDAKLKDRSKL